MTERLILTLAILGGTGPEGRALARRWAAAGYPVIVGSRQEERAQQTAAKINERLGLESVRGMENAAAARTADICVLTVPPAAHESVLRSLKESLRGKILVDTTSRIELPEPTPPKGPSAARMAQRLLGSETRVVAAFHTIPARALRGAPDRPVGGDALICADDEGAAAEVAKLAEAAGMRSFFAGGLDNAVVLEGLVALLFAINRHQHSNEATLRISGVER
jgi:hypothetical protein